MIWVMEAVEVRSTDSALRVLPSSPWGRVCSERGDKQDEDGDRNEV